jgi:hypothetical protein
MQKLSEWSFVPLHATRNHLCLWKSLCLVFGNFCTELPHFIAQFILLKKKLKLLFLWGFMKLVYGLQYCQLDPSTVKHIFQKHWLIAWCLLIRASEYSSYKKSNKMQQCIKIYYFIFIWSSTCFGRHTAHHREPKTALAASGFAYVEGCWTCADSCADADSVQQAHVQQPSTYAKPEAASAVLGSRWWAVCRPKHVELHMNCILLDFLYELVN